MPGIDGDEAVARVVARYAGCGRFARHYVAGKLRHDPLTRTLLDGGRLGRVVDLGCGRGQFAGLLLEAGLASEVVGVDGNARLLADAARALRGLAFRPVSQDFAADAGVPEADTVLLADVLYQLAPATQARLLASACAAAPVVLIRTADPSAGARARFTALVERVGRRFWPHAGRVVAARPVAWVAGRVEAAGFRVAVAPSWAGTPFANVLLVATRATAG